MKLLAIVLSPSLCRHIRHPKTEQNKTIAQSPQNTPNIHHMIICPNRLLHCKILYIDHYRNIVPRSETKSLSLNALMWAKNKNKHTKFPKNNEPPGHTYNRSKGSVATKLWLIGVSDVIFATPPLTINAIYDLSANGGHHHADCWQLLKGHSPTWGVQACWSLGDLSFPI